MILEAYYFMRGVNCGGNVFSKINAPALSSRIEALIVVSPIVIPTALPSDSVISMIGKSYIELWDRALISDSIVDSAVSVHNFDSQ